MARAAREFPAVVLTGPRQSGKTTLLRRLFDRSHGYVSLEPPDLRASANADPRGFVDAHPAPVILDEAQHAPDLIVYVKERIDGARARKGQWLLTGSQNLLLHERVSESLAGRAAIMRLLPLSLREIVGRPGAALPWESRERRNCAAARPVAPSLVAPALWKVLARGCYPELHAEPDRDAAAWHASYAQTFLERDVRSLRQIGDLTQFQGFLRMLAARSGGLLSLSDLSRDLGIAVNTVKAWISVLEATDQIIILRPWFANVGKRLVKMPKVYFTDTGTLCHLVGIRDAAHAAAGPLGGTLLETAVLSEIVKTYRARGEDPRVSFYRTSTGIEVDFIVESAGRLVPIEVKLSSTPKPTMAAGIRSFREAAGEAAAEGYVVHPGEVRLPLGDGAIALPIGEL